MSTKTKDPTTPHELHELGTLTPGHAARFIGTSRTCLYGKIEDGEMPVTTILGKRRVEPLVAWAARKGASRKTLHDVADALRDGKGVDEIVAIVRDGLVTSPPEPRRKKQAKEAT